jgi:hypothetical protein
MAAPVTPVLTFIFQVSLNQGQTHARSWMVVISCDSHERFLRKPCW